MAYQVADKEPNEMLRHFGMVAALYDVDVRELSIPEYRAKVQGLEFTNRMPVLDKLEPKFKLNGVEFTRIIDIDELSGGQLIDFTIIKERDNMAEILAVMYKHPTMNFKDRVKHIRDYETFEHAHPYMGFFLGYLKELLRGIQKFLKAQEMITKPVSRLQQIQTRTTSGG